MHAARRLITIALLGSSLAACAGKERDSGASDAPSTGAPPATPLNARIDSLVAESMRDGKVPGLSISIVRGDTLIHSKGYGFANLEKQVAMTDSTPVVIGSTSKTFTSFSVMQLVDSGRVALDSTIPHYVALLRASSGPTPATKLKPADPRFTSITVRQLLTHVSGITSGFSGDAYDAVDTSSDALVRLVREDMIPRRLDSAPGRAFKYSNRGLSLVSLIVQDVSGMSYEDYIAKHIFEPLGMTHSTGRFWEGGARGMVQGYRESRDGTPLPRPASLGREWTGSGMILSTSRDVATFLRTMLDSGRAPNGKQLLSAASVVETMRPQQKAESELGGETMYGLGWEVTEMNGVPVVMKGGSVGSMGSLFVLIPSRRLGIALVFNDIDYGKVGLIQNIVKVLLGAPTSPYVSVPAKPPVPASTYRMPTARLATFVGVYDTRAGVMRLTMHGDTLAGRFEGNDFTLEPTSDSSFVGRSVLAEQEGAALIIKRCGKTMCVWMGGDSSAVRR